MRLLICLITYNRLLYTQKTLDAIKSTITVPHFLVIVDNGSTDGTVEWLRKEGPQDMLILNPKNLYPGRACNMGWEMGLKQFDATHLMRCDNDMDFAPGWDKEVEAYFEAMPPLGQLGLDVTALDTWNKDERWITEINGKSINAWPGNVGGPCVIRREIWDMGARYDETPWHDDRKSPDEMITPQEDVKFSLSMHKYGFIYGHPTEFISWTFADEHNRGDYADYYEKTFRERGYTL